MVCKYCNVENDNDAVFCKNCGKKLKEDNLCSNCGCKNDEDAKYCKQCGNELGGVIKETKLKNSSKKVEILSLCKFIMQIVSICFCSLIILLSFGACFSPYLFSNVTTSGNIEQMGFFSFINSLKEYQFPERLYGSEFHFLSNALPNIVGIIGASLALLGCSICLIYSLVVGIKVACKGQIPDLKKPALYSTCSLLLGYLIVSLMFTSLSASIYVSVGALLQGGGLVLSAIALGLAWWFLSFIGNAVIELFESFELKKLRNYIFKLGEFTLLLIILFNVSSGFVSFVKPVLASSMEVQFSGISFLSAFSNVVYSNTQLDEYFTFEGDLAVSYYFVIVCCILLLIVVILLSIFFAIRANKKENRSSISTGIVFFSMSLVLLIISCITVQMLKAPNGGANFIMDNLFDLGLLDSFDSCKVGLSANLIVTMIFSTGLFVLEIVWNRLEVSTKTKVVNQNA